MKSIFDLIYDNDIFRTTDNNSLGSEYNAALKRLCKAEKQILECYPDCADILAEYQNAQVEMTSIAQRYEFEKGIRVGAQFILEIIKPL